LFFKKSGVILNYILPKKVGQKGMKKKIFKKLVMLEYYPSATFADIFSIHFVVETQLPLYLPSSQISHPDSNIQTTKKTLPF
jgi:hypothetical protein